MGVLEARAKAEKITYPVVGEKTKDADNVIDYDIREEQTKDISAEINANNQTTTGMATVIPGVNAPKLIEATSIISKREVGYIYAYAKFRGNRCDVGDITSMWCWEITNQIGEPQFTISGNYLVVPADGIYQLKVEFPFSGDGWYWRGTTIRSNLQGTIAYEVESAKTAHVYTYTISLKKGEKIDGITQMLGGYNVGLHEPFVYIDFTRLGS